MRKISGRQMLMLGGVCLATTLALLGCGGTNDGAQPTPTPGISLAGLTLLMHFDEGAWTGAANEVLDVSGTGNHGKAVGGATTVATAKFGRAGSFGAGSAVQILDNASLHPTNQLTITAWVYPNNEGNGNYRGIVAKRVDYGKNSSFTLFLDPNNHLCADINTEDDRFCIPATVGSGQWSHVALVYDGTVAPAARVSLYINGQLAGVGSESSASIQSFDSALWIGCLPLSGPAQSIVGLVDEVAIWYRVLDSKDIRALAQATTPLSK
jgi:MSHA biogenesis protein MshQ